MATLKVVTLLLRDVKAAVPLWRDGMGCAVRVLGDQWAEVDTGATPLALKGVDRCAAARRGAALSVVRCGG